MAKNEGKSSQSPFVYKLILLVVIIAVLFFGAHTFFFQKMDSEITKLTTQKRELEEKVAKAQSFKVKEKENELEYNAIREELAVTRRILPLKTQVEELVNRMNDQAIASSIQLLVFHRPEKQINKEFYDELPIVIECNSRFKELREFFRFLAEYRQIINVNNVEIRTLKRTSKSKQSLNAKFTAATFVYTGEKSEEIE